MRLQLNRKNGINGITMTKNNLIFLAITGVCVMGFWVIQFIQGIEMKKIVEEVNGEGLDKLMGERVTLFCLNYIYTGKLIGVNDTCVLLSDPAIVYETGAFDESDWKDAQNLPNDLYIQTCMIESFGLLK